MLHDLVLAATALNDGSFRSLHECQLGFRDLWALEVEIDEIRVVRDELSAAGKLETRGGGFALTDVAREDLESRAAASAATEDQALADWRQSLQSQRPDITEEDFEAVCGDLGAWLNRIIIRHGVEAALLLYPEEERARRLFEQIEGLGTGFLPERTGVVGQIRGGCPVARRTS